jgi:hypothetical protein
MSSIQTENLVRLVVCYTHNADGNLHPVPQQKCFKKLNPARLKYLERNMLGKNGRGHWKYAYVVPAGGSTLKLWYYYPTKTIKGIPERLNIEAYVEALNDHQTKQANYSLWRVPTTNYRVRTNQQRMPNVLIPTLDEYALRKQLTRDVLRIDIYQNRVKIAEYDRRGFRRCKPRT